MKVFYYLSVSFLLNFFVVIATAQESETSIEVPAIVPPSPDVAALGKYGNTQVGLHSGIPQISIPLYPNWPNWRKSVTCARQ